MKVMLLRDLETLGKAGEIVQVAAGHARNFLIPKRQAMLASDTNVAQFETQRRQHEATVDRELSSAQEKATELEKASLTAQVRVGEGDRLFGSVTTQNIVDLLKEQGHDVDRRAIQLEEPIRALGEYNIEVQLPSSVTATVKLWVAKE